MDSLPFFLLVVIFVAAAAVVWVAGIQLSKATDVLDARLHLGSALGGLIVLAVATNLPEIAITVSAAVSGNLEVAVGNILGGIALQTVVLVILDAFGKRGRGVKPLTYRAASLTLVLEGLVVVAVLAVVIAGSQLPSGLEVLRLTPDVVLIAALWIVGLILVQRAGSHLPWHEDGRAPDATPKPHKKDPTKAMSAKKADFQDLMLEADQIHADGMPMIMYSRMFSSHPVSERIATTDLVQSVALKAERAGVSFYFLGGTEEVNAKAVAAMRTRYPNLTFAGRRNGYFKRGEEDAVIADIQASKPDILWIGLGFPLEQAFVSRNIDRLRSVGVIKTSGGLFDFVSGKNARAPLWMQRYGLEWAYRMYNEPRRLTMRYLLSNPAAIRALFTHSN